MYALAKALLLPPACLLIAAAVARSRRIAAAAALVALLLSLPAVSSTLLYGLARTFPPLPADGPLPAGARAIVILGAEVRDYGEFAARSPGPLTLERLRYGAALHRRSGLPILVTGGPPRRGGAAVAAAMRQTLAAEFGVPVAWAETQAADTYDNARFSAHILLPLGIRRILLVTHAWHLARAVPEFRAAGFEVIPAPTGYRGPPAWSGLTMAPDPNALTDAYYAAHEYLGRLYYQFRHWRRSSAVEAEDAAALP